MLFILWCSVMQQTQPQCLWIPPLPNVRIMDFDENLNFTQYWPCQRWASDSQSLFLDDVFWCHRELPLSISLDVSQMCVFASHSESSTAPGLTSFLIWLVAIFSLARLTTLFLQVIDHFFLSSQVGPLCPWCPFPPSLPTQTLPVDVHGRNQASGPITSCAETATGHLAAEEQNCEVLKRNNLKDYLLQLLNLQI